MVVVGEEGSLHHVLILVGRGGVHGYWISSLNLKFAEIEEEGGGGQGHIS